MHFSLHRSGDDYFSQCVQYIKTRIQFVLKIRMSTHFYCFQNDYDDFTSWDVGYWYPLIGVAHITQLRACVIKIVTFKGSHLMW